jgi:RND superfamily putative drug exporter
MAMGAIVAVFTALLAALTLLPALLGAMGDRVNALRVPFLHKTGGTGRAGGFWDRLSNGVMRRPVISLVVAGGALAMMAATHRSGLGGRGHPAPLHGFSPGFEVLQKDSPAPRSSRSR